MLRTPSFSRTPRGLVALAAAALAAALAFSPTPVRADADAMEAVFSDQSLTGHVMAIEAALAGAQAARGIIPQAAADEIARTADVRYAPQDALAAEYDVVRHRMVALLNVWGRSLEGGAEEWLHYGATTVDLYDTALVLQLREATALLLADLRALEDRMIALATTHRATPMIGRTLGQQALPITFGKKVSTWLLENRRHIERLEAVDAKLAQSTIMKGAVGTYLGLGDEAVEVEADIARALGQAEPYPADWHGTRDVPAEYALVLGLIAKSWGRIGGELFLLQTTEIGETVERRPASAVGSSTMPHKNNPSLSEALVQHSRIIPRLADVVADDVVNLFERDNTSRPNRVLEEISIEAADMLNAARRLLDRLEVNTERMAANLELTRGGIMAQRVVFALAPEMGKKTANDRMHELAVEAAESGRHLKDVVAEDPEIGALLGAEELDALFDPTTYLGLAAESVDRSIAYVKAARARE